jgi:hypothetical protein
MKLTQSTWSPFQSPEVREICGHLSAAERQELLSLARGYGQETAWRFALPFGLVAFAFFSSRPVGFALLAPFVIYCLTVERARIRAHQRRVREFLAGTQYAREHGFQSGALRLFAFPWSR